MRLSVVVVSALILSSASIVHGQTGQPRISVEGTLGHAAFLDEDPVDHFVFGGAFRYRLSPRVSVGPEVIYMIGPGRDRDLFVTGNMWFDFVSSRPDRRVTPYLVAGGGLMRHRSEFIDFVAYEGAVTGGFGVRIALSGGWYIAPEARLGWEPHLRLSANVGYSFR
jgi:hypothetical protein